MQFANDGKDIYTVVCFMSVCLSEQLTEHLFRNLCNIFPRHQYDHPGHNFVRLSDAAEEMRSALVPAMDRCRKTLKLLDSTEKELEAKVVKDIQAGAEHTAAIVRDNFQVLGDCRCSCLIDKEKMIIIELINRTNFAIHAGITLPSPKSRGRAFKRDRVHVNGGDRTYSTTAGVQSSYS